MLTIYNNYSAGRIFRPHCGIAPNKAFGIEDKCCLRVAYGALQKATATEGIGRLVKGLKQILAT